MARINISIPQPCQENWETMTPSDRGRFCASCQKNVIDFTKASDREIVSAFQQNNNLCGRFLNSQLNRDLVKSEKKNPVWLATVTAFISLFSLNEVVSQEKTPTEQTINQKISGITPKLMIQIKGQVLDDEGSPLGNVLILVKNKKITFSSDESGNFNVLIEPRDILFFSKEGYTSENEEYFFDTERGHFNVRLYKVGIHSYMLGGAISGTMISSKKRTLFGRFFHWIGNLFR